MFRYTPDVFVEYRFPTLKDLLRHYFPKNSIQSLKPKIL